MHSTVYWRFATATKTRNAHRIYLGNKTSRMFIYDDIMELIWPFLVPPILEISYKEGAEQKHESKNQGKKPKRHKREG